VKKWILFLSSVFLTSCGYRWDGVEELPTLSVPFIVGDEDGRLTTEIIHEMAKVSAAEVVAGGGDYRLQVQLKDTVITPIGFRIDPQKIRGEIKDNLLASEGRTTIRAEVSLFEGDRVVFGPKIISAFVDYDYVDGDSLQDLTFTSPTGALITVLPFSLGQLDSPESAQEGALRPLYRKLAQKIIDGIAPEMVKEKCTGSDSKIGRWQGAAPDLGQA
jgi:hypothetical protein